MERIKIEATVREKTGKEIAKKIRRAGEAPGIVYAKGDNLIISVGRVALKTLKSIGYSGSTIIDMQINGAKAENPHVLLKKTQFHPVNEAILHLDFMRVALDEKIKVHIPLVAKGEAKGVKEGGVLEQIMYDIIVEALPLDIPHKIEVDVSELIIGRSLHVSDVKVPANVRIVNHLEETIVTVVSHVEEAAPAAEAGAAATEPEVIKEKKDAPADGAAPADGKKAPAADAKKPAADAKKPAAGKK
jgi:large subunit ribosomal protein L25